MTFSHLILTAAVLVALFVRKKIVNRGRNIHVFTEAENWQAEDELAQELPRKVRFYFSTGGFFYFWISVAAITFACIINIKNHITRADVYTWLTLIAIILMVTIIRWYLVRRFELPLIRYGIPTRGKIIREDIGDGPNTYVLIYEVNGVKYRGYQSSFGIDAYKGEYLTILYDPDDPNTAVVYAFSMYRAKS